MAESYKGLTVKFGADYSSLSGALSSIGKESSSAARELKQVQSALKLDPGNTTLLGKQQEAYAKQVAATKQKLDAYKDAYGQLEAKQASGAELTDREKVQYQNLSTSIATTEARLKSYTEKLASATASVQAHESALGKVGTKLQEVGSKTETAGTTIKSAGTVMTTASVAAGAAAMSAWSQVDAAQDSAVAKTGATGEAAEELGQTVSNVAAQAPGDWSTIGDAVGSVEQRFNVTGEAAENLSTQFLQFSDNMNVDVSTAVDGVGRSMDAFNVPADQATNVLGVFEDTSQRTGASIDTLISSVDTNGAAFREMGLSLDDSVTLLGNFEQAGIPIETMLPGLKRAMVNCQQSGQDMGMSMSDLATRLQDPTQRAQAAQDAIDLFGSRSAGAFIDAAESGRLNLGGLDGTLDSFGNKVSETFDATVDGPDKMKFAFKSLQSALAQIGAQLAPVIGSLATHVQNLAKSFQNLPESTKKTISSLILFGATVGPVLIVIGTLMTKLKPLGDTLVQLATKVAGLKTATSGIGGVISGLGAGPLAAIIIAIAAVAASVKYLWDTNESFRNNLTQAWGTITSALQPAQEAFGRVGESIQRVLTVAQPVFDVLANIIGGVFVAAVDSAAAVVGGAIAGISGAFEMVQGVIETVVGIVVGIFTGDWSTALNGAQTVAQGFVDGVTGIFNGLSGIVQGVVDGVVGMFTHCFDSIHVPTFHVDGGFNLDPANFQLPSISFYAQGGIVDQATLGVFGEAGTEINAPLDKAPQLIADTMAKLGTNVGGMSKSDMAAAVASGVSDALKSGGVGIFVDGKQLNDSLAGYADIKFGRMQTLGGALV